MAVSRKLYVWQDWTGDWQRDRRDDLTLDLGPRIAERAQTPSPLSHQDADRDDLLQPKFYYFSAKQIKICNISKAVTVIFIFWRPPFLFSTRGQLTAEPPCTTLIMIPSAPLFLTSFEIVLLIINFALFSYGYPGAARMSLWEEGGANLFNSDTKKRIYFYANHPRSTRN